MLCCKERNIFHAPIVHAVNILFIFVFVFQYQNAVSASPSEVLAATPEDLSLKVEEGKDGRPVVLSMPYVRGKLEKGGVIQPGMVSHDSWCLSIFGRIVSLFTGVSLGNSWCCKG